MVGWGHWGFSPFDGTVKQRHCILKQVRGTGQDNVELVQSVFPHACSLQFVKPAVPLNWALSNTAPPLNWAFVNQA